MRIPPVISLVLPCRDQADHIGPILRAYLGALEALGVPFELVVVPNASTDATAEVVEELARCDPRLRSLPNPGGGWGLSVRLGLAAAAGTVLAYTNTARTDPASIPAFIRLYQKKAPCLVKATRIRRHVLLRATASFFYNLEGRLLFGLRTRDVNGTPKVFSRELYQTLILTADGDLLDLELMAAVTRLRTRVFEIPVQGFRRHGGKSSTTFRSAWNLYTGALGLWATRPWRSA